MTDAVPQPWEFVLLALGVYRTWKLIGEDTLTEAPRDWLTDRLPEKLALAITCPWCAGLWVTYGIYAAWLWQPKWTLVYTALMGMNAVVGMLETARSRMSD